MTSPAASVVICTYNRLRMLQDAVESCLRDASARGTAFEVVVADNSPSGHARDFAAGLAAAGHAVRWVHASPPNISVARNAGLHAAAAPLVAFMDDDLVLEPGWLDHLLDTLDGAGRTSRSARCARASPPAAAPDWDPAGSRFTRVLPLPPARRWSWAGPGARAASPSAPPPRCGAGPPASPTRRRSTRRSARPAARIWTCSSAWSGAAGASSGAPRPGCGRPSPPAAPRCATRRCARIAARRSTPPPPCATPARRPAARPTSWRAAPSRLWAAWRCWRCRRCAAA